MKKVICFGEIMIRYSPLGYKRFVQAESMEMLFGGAEANVAVTLANFGLTGKMVTKLPAHEIGQSVVNALRRYGVDTSDIVRGGERVGIYYTENGAAQRATKVIYDRKHSAIAEASREDFDWDKIFEGANWFHFTGITPALGDNVAEICMDACKAAKARNIPISCDINYRKNLWTIEKAGRVMSGFMKYVDVCLGGDDIAYDLFGIKPDVDENAQASERYKSVAGNICRKFGCKKVVFTFRTSYSASDNDFSGMLYDAASDECVFSKTYSIHIVDRIGGGDSLCGGLIYSMLNGKSLSDTIELAVAASVMKHSIEGDFSMMSLSEVEALANGDSSGRVQR